MHYPARSSVAELTVCATVGNEVNINLIYVRWATAVSSH
jgi:hypothetical protein